jgi:antitoxin component of MazEF toxin-antitoxin module
MGYKERRRIVRFGATSRAMVLPKGWLEFYDFKEGDGVTVLGDSVLVVCHPKDERKARRILGLMERRGKIHSE